MTDDGPKTEHGFRPHFDFRRVTPEMANELRKSLRLEQLNREMIALSDDDEDVTEMVASYLELRMGTDQELTEMIGYCWVIPTMVHTAGKAELEQHPDDPLREYTVQRCVRCKALLMVYEAEHPPILDLQDGRGLRHVDVDEFPWFDEGIRIAKSDCDDHFHCAVLDKDHKLESHERECVDLHAL